MGLARTIGFWIYNLFKPNRLDFVFWFGIVDDPVDGLANWFCKRTALRRLILGVAH